MLTKDKVDRKTIIYAALISFRCEFVGNGPLKRNPLTKKGHGLIKLPARFWRFYNNVLCRISKKYREHMLYWLNLVIEDNKYHDN